MVCVGTDKCVEGVITDGDVRRALSKCNNFDTLKAKKIATINPIFVQDNTGLSEMNRIFQEKKVLSLLVGSKSNLTGASNFMIYKMGKNLYYTR